MHYLSINGNKSDDKKVTDYRNVHHNLTPHVFWTYILKHVWRELCDAPLLVQGKALVQAPGSKAPVLEAPRI